MTNTINPRVCVIGAGVSGLTSAKYLKEEGINFTVLEATQYVGGTWRYDSRVGADENGLPLFTSMYKHLRVNLPRQAMELIDFPMPHDMPPFPSGEVFYNYLQSYAKHFDLLKHIQFLHLVVSVRRCDNKWVVNNKDVISGEEFMEEFDYIFVGSGHFSKPNFPNISGEHLFKGTILHSHDYREPKRYENRRVLIIGAGPSGMDISLEVVYVCKTLIHSHHSSDKFRTPYPNNYILKPSVKEFNETGVVFADGSFEEIDDIIYCTGFQCHYPFLDESSGLTIRPLSVTRLYKHMVNINEPTLIIMGLVNHICVVVAIEAQARYAVALVKGNFKLPSKGKMMEEWQKLVDAVLSKGRPLSDIHFLDEKEDEYYAELTRESGIARVPPVMFKMRCANVESISENLYTYRKYKYTIIDDETFTRELVNLTF